MQKINLIKTPKQSISARLDDVYTTIRIYEGNGTMIADIERDGEAVIKGQRIIAGEPLIPFTYRENGNFVLLSNDDEIPHWKNFGDTQTLIYLTIAEVEQYQNG